MSWNQKTQCLVIFLTISPIFLPLCSLHWCHTGLLITFSLITSQLFPLSRRFYHQITNSLLFFIYLILILLKDLSLPLYIILPTILTPSLTLHYLTLLLFFFSTWPLSLTTYKKIYLLLCILFIVCIPLINDSKLYRAQIFVLISDVIWVLITQSGTQ